MNGTTHCQVRKFKHVTIILHPGAGFNHRMWVKYRHALLLSIGSGRAESTKVHQLNGAQSLLVS